MAKIVLQGPGRADPVEVQIRPSGTRADAFESKIGTTARTVQLQPLDDGQGRLIIDGRVVPFFVTRDGRIIEVWLNGRTYRFHTVSGRRRPAGGTAAVASGEIRAPMPGTILKVCVAPGEVVVANE